MVALDSEAAVMRRCANPTLTEEGRSDVGCRIKK